MKDNQNRKIGTEAEIICQKYLIKTGYEILESNFHSAYGEIDIIAREGNYLVFVEVKYRTSLSEDSAKNAVSYQKQRKLIKTAMIYYAHHDEAEALYSRFDVILINPKEEENSYDIKHFKDAFRSEDIDFE